MQARPGHPGLAGKLEPAARTSASPFDPGIWNRHWRLISGIDPRPPVIPNDRPHRGGYAGPSRRSPRFRQHPRRAGRPGNPPHRCRRLYLPAILAAAEGTRRAACLPLRLSRGRGRRGLNPALAASAPTRRSVEWECPGQSTLPHFGVEQGDARRFLLAAHSLRDLPSTNRSRRHVMQRRSGAARPPVR